MDIKIYRFKKYEGESNTKAFVDLLVDNELIIKGFKLIEGKTGLFLGVPREKSKDGDYYDLIRFNTLEQKREIENLVIKRYEAEGE